MAPKTKGTKPDKWTKRQLRTIAQYQFGPEFADILAPEGIFVTFSKRTKKVREIIYNDQRLATLRPTDGAYSLGIAGAERIVQETKSPKRRVVVLTDIAEFIADGRNVFAKHVVSVDPTIQPEDEVIIVSEEDKLLAVGRAKLSAEYMLAFQSGTAVKVRYGIKKLQKK